MRKMLINIALEFLKIIIMIWILFFNPNICLFFVIFFK